MSCKFFSASVINKLLLFVEREKTERGGLKLIEFLTFCHVERTTILRSWNFYVSEFENYKILSDFYARLNNHHLSTEFCVL